MGGGRVPAGKAARDGVMIEDREDDRAIPWHLFKYRSLSGESLKWTRELILQGKLWFPSPLDFNDPFDTLPDIRIEGTRDQLQRRVRRLVRSNRPDLPRGARLELSEYIISKGLPAMRAYLEDAVRQTASELAVCSYTTRVDDILMWSHYADQHRGICVRMSTRSPFFMTSLPFPVRYQETRPAIDWMADELDTELIDILVTKASLWKHEREWRQLEKGPGIRRLPDRTLEAIYLGCRISSEDRQLVLQWVKDLTWPVEIHAAKPSRSAFALEFERLG